jgi:hypothetical protein
MLEKRKTKQKYEVYQSSKCKRTRRMLTLIGTMDPRFMVSLDLSLSNNGVYHLSLQHLNCTPHGHPLYKNFFRSSSKESIIKVSRGHI